MQEFDPEDLQLKVYPDPFLREPCKAVIFPVSQMVVDAANAMLDIMYDEDGIGLAAPQAGLNFKMIVYDLSSDGEEPCVLLNPEIVSQSGGLVDSEEGCLSVPGIRATVRRHARVKVKGYSLDGEPQEIEADDLMSAMFQHELDHLEGRLFIDRLGPSEKMRVRKDIEELEELYQLSQ